jgi:hypothetical protein
MRIGLAVEALERGCCLELYYERYAIVVEPHAVGFDRFGRPCLLAYERFTDGMPSFGQWLFLPLDKARWIDVSGYFSEGPRPAFVPDDLRFARIVAQLDPRHEATAA